MLVDLTAVHYSHWLDRPSKRDGKLRELWDSPKRYNYHPDKLRAMAKEDRRLRALEP
jgi:hypothetical protein